MTYSANILKGEVDAFRTPIYPYIAKFVSMFTRDTMVKFKSIALLQEIVSLISVIVLHKTLKKIFKKQIVIDIATIFYACLPAIFTYNRVMLTESLSISLFVMYFSLIIRYIQEPTNRSTIYIGLYTFLLIMLRPSFIYLGIALAIIFVMMFILKKENKEQAVLGAGTLVCVGLAILGYCYLNKKQNNIFAISNVTHINQLDTVIAMGIYNTRDAQDQGIIDIIEQKLDGDSKIWFRATTTEIMTKYTPDEVDAYLKRCINNNFSIYLKKTIEKVLNIIVTPCDQIYLAVKGNRIIPPILYFAIIYIYIAFEIIYILFQIIKNKKIYFESILMFLFIAGQLATIILGAQAEYSRLFVTALPIVIIAIAWHIDKILEIKKLDSLKYITDGSELEKEKGSKEEWTK